MKRAAWLIESGLSLVLSVPFAVLPFKWSLKTGGFLGLLLFYLWGSRRRIAIENLKKTTAVRSLASPDTAESIIKDSFKNLGMSLAEVIRIYYGFGRKIIDSVRIDGIDHFHAARSKGKGVLFISGHCGNWELLAIAASARLAPASVVARPINNPYINRLVERARRKYGNSVIYKKGALKSVLRGVKNNDCVGILMDQAVLPEEGFVIDFLGRGAWTTKMPALISRKTGAAVLPVFIRRENDGHVITIYPEIELSGIEDRDKAVEEDTKKFSACIERYIREHPAEWLWIHRRWKRVNN